MKKICGEGCRDRGRGEGGDMKRCCVSGRGALVWYGICRISLSVWGVWVL